jgi:hypothetical protein
MAEFVLLRYHSNKSIYVNVLLNRGRYAAVFQDRYNKGIDNDSTAYAAIIN